MMPASSVGGHNTYVVTLVLFLCFWTYRVFRQIYDALCVLVVLQPEDASGSETVLSRVGLRRPAESSVLVLPGVNELVDEFKLLNRRHIEQIIAASADLRHPPQTPLVQEIPAHINVESISQSLAATDGSVAFTVDATRQFVAFACLNLPLSVVEDEAGRRQDETQDLSTGSRWWRDVLWTSFGLKQQMAISARQNSDSENQRRLSSLGALAASGTRLTPGIGLAVRLVPSPISGDGRTFVPLVLGVASGDAVELTLCKFQISTDRKIEVVKQILLPSYVAISGLYGLEENQTNECMICCDERINTALLPCCHCALCENCAPNLRDGRCPICRVFYTGYVSLPFRRNDASAGVLSPLLPTSPRPAS